MGAYGIFMGPAVSIMLCEYYLISKGNIYVPSIYVGNKHNKNYWYYGGWNIQAYAAYITAVGLCMIGFVNKVGAAVPPAGVKLGELGWLITFPTGAVVYYVLCKIWPHQNYKNMRDLRWEELAKRDEGVLDGVSHRHSDVESLGKAAGDDTTDAKN